VKLFSIKTLLTTSIMNKTTIEELHKKLLTCWNDQDARGMASLFAADGNVIGFDGSEISGQSQIEIEMQKIFASHKTATYVWKVREVRFLSETVSLLRAVVGMVPPGDREIMPDRNAIQSLIAVKENADWKIALFHNTPAQFHGRQEASEALTNELSELV
jgi:uncharacterized protein (TIGR02246 family)